MVLLIIHLLACAYLTGLIWFVQVVHYPLFDRVGPQRFCEYESRHVSRTTQVVAPAMLIELVCALAIPWSFDLPVIRMLAGIGLVLLAGIWLSTFWLQVPCHRRLKAAHDPAAIRRLIRTNWLRTIGWTIRCALAAAMVLLYRG